MVNSYSERGPILFLILVLLLGSSMVILSFGFSLLPEHQYSEEGIKDSEYQKRMGSIQHESILREICIVSIDSGKTWILVTPNKEFIGYLHKKLPDVNPQSIPEVTEFKQQSDKFYYSWL